MKRRILLTIAGIFAAVLSSAQGLYVQPASYEMSVKAGGSYDLPITIRNNQSDLPDNVEVSGLYLTQTLQGFDSVEQEKVTAEFLKGFPSCLSWLKLPTQTKFPLQPLGQQALNVRLTVPGSARGFYGAVIVVTSQRPQPGPGLKLVLRFLVPIMIHVDSGVSRKGGQIDDAAAFFVPADKTRTAGTLVACMVKNTGDALCRYTGTANVFQIVNGRKRRVIAGTFEERRVIPNATVALTFMSPNRLPSGNYRIETTMSMEGQKMPPFGKDVDVKGDPSIKNAVADIELGLSPDPLEFDATPGATRGIAFKVSNSGSDPVIVDAFVTTPKAMEGTASSRGTGESFSVAPWFTQPLTGSVIGAGQERTLRILSTVPEGLLVNPLYYGELHVVAKTQEGVTVGSGTLLMVGKTKGLKPTLKISSRGEIILSSVKTNVFGFTSVFENTGDGDLEVQFEARITDTARINTVQNLDTGDLPKRILPFEIVRPSGKIDLASIKNGVYIVEITAKSGDLKETRTAGIRVTTENGVKKLSLVSVPRSEKG